ncbi:MAG: EamA family transporter [Halobacteriovorax sp.]|nr:EamA family transporter [Halobacteriovorax sp.]|tara:strand:- start:73299 stop:74192 length:894 start_codon:yes stop_codon:yes gene_type:complete
MGILFIVLACSTWAVDTLIRYPLLGEASALQIVFGEHLILSVLFIPFFFKSVKKIWKMEVSHIFSFIIIGGMGSALGTLAFTAAFSKINPSLVILLQKLQPLVAVSLARIVLKEPVQKKFLSWALLCLIGGILISYQDIFPGLMKLDFRASFGNETAMWGYLLTLIAVVSWGASTVFGKKLELQGYSEFEVMGGRFWLGAIALIPVLISQGEGLATGTEVWGKILALVAISGLLGMWLYYHGLKKLSARLCALAEMFFPFCAVTVNWIFLGKTLDITQIVGGGLLLLGSTVIQVKRY